MLHRACILLLIEFYRLPFKFNHSYLDVAIALSSKFHLDLITPIWMLPHGINVVISTMLSFGCYYLA